MNNLAEQLAAQLAPARRAPAPVAEHLTLDPFTGRAICLSCWNRVHGSMRSRGVCQIPDCACGCEDGLAVRRKERATKKAVREQRKALERPQLEFPANPLRAYNPGTQEPWLTLPKEKL